MTVRPGSPDDRDFVLALARATAAVSLSPLRPVPEKALLRAVDRLFETVEAQSHVLLVAEADGRRCGFVLMLDGLPDEVTGLPQGFVAYMAVDPSNRRSGVGTALLEAAEDEARRRGLPHMTLMVTEENHCARELYAARGYATERRLLCKAL